MTNDLFITPATSGNNDRNPNQFIMKNTTGTFIDLENMNYESNIIGLDIDLRNRYPSNVKIDFNCNLFTSLIMNEWLELVFSLYRYDYKGTPTLLFSLPYKSIFSEEVLEDQTPITIGSEKNDSISFSYFDNSVQPSIYKYVVKAELNYINVEAAQIQTSTLSILAQ